ncbi:MAG: MaoC family dehydratase N-terminal domain-containing protein [Pseudomonadales bacterium]|nr:MaoC family dehydratase N-terminal domain-containing protein [Pseudomonadales bacterium]
MEQKDIKSVIGRETLPKTITVEQGQLQFFAKATGASDKLYWDVEAAKAAGHPAIPAPPTFLMCLDSLCPSKEASILAYLGVDIGKILHGEQRFSYAEPIYAGDEITFTSVVLDAYDKKGGALQFIVSEAQAVNQNGKTVGTMTNTLVIRN